MSDSTPTQLRFNPMAGYADGNDANSLRHDPAFKLAVGRAPLEAHSALASAPTFSRLENGLSRKDVHRLAQAFVEAFIDSYATAPAVMVLDMDHPEDRTHGQQELAFYNHHYASHCYMPLFLFEGLSGKLITAVLRPGKRPTGRENAAIIGRVVRRLRQAWPHTHIVLRGDGHFANPELMALCSEDDHLNFIFGLAGNKALTPKAEPLLARARAACATQRERPPAAAHGPCLDPALRRGGLSGRILAHRVPGRVQSRSHGPGRQPALRGHVTGRTNARGVIPRLILRPWSGRELHQGNQKRLGE